MHVACGVAYDEVSGAARFNYQSRLVLLLGMPRSGTTWLAKILDSHPETLYRHEPEIVHRHDKIPYSCTREDASAYVGAMQARLNLLVNDRSARTVGSRPVFAKSFHTPRQTVLRRMMIGALKSVGRIPSVGRWSNSVQVPDFVDLRSDSVKRIIIKSIGAPMERIEIIKAAAPGLQFILLVRHPCGQVASMLRGIRWSKFEHPIGVPEPNTAARQRGLTKEALARMSLVAQLAWNWVIRNELALEALRGAAHVRIVRYEDLAADPVAVSSRLFTDCGLDWRQETAKFVQWSRRGTGREGYYEVRRDPLQAAYGWREQLTASEIAEIHGIVRQSTSLAPFY